MKKKFAAIFGLLTLGFSGGFTLLATSCSKSSSDGDDEPDRQQYYDYINARTLSVAGIAVSSSTYIVGGSMGTMWFYKRVGQYKYQFITNYHVLDGFVQAYDLAHSKSGFSILGVLSYTEGQSRIGNYISVGSGGYSRDLNQYSPITKCFNYPESSPTNHYMDMAAITVDLSQVYRAAGCISGGTQGLQEIKDKITDINTRYKIGDKIIDFARPQKSENVYIAGYPWQNTYSDTGSRGWTQFTKETDIIDELSPIRTFNVSEDYATEQATGWLPARTDFELGGGASGSMVINKYFQVVGIYWGGTRRSSSDTFVDFSPSFALFDYQNAGGTNFNFFTDLVDITN